MTTYLDLIINTVLIRAGNTDLAQWSDIDTTDATQAKILLELNNSLRDIWLDNCSLFEDRIASMTTVIGQHNYDMPYNGMLKQDGVLLQPQDTNGDNVGKQEVLKWNPNYTKFFQDNVLNPQLSQPREYTFFNNQMYLYPYPDKAYVCTLLYESTNWALSNTTVDVISNAGQKVLSVASTQEFSTGNIIIINRGTITEETGVIASIQAGISLTFVGNLTFTHQINEPVIFEKQSLDYANDTPNWDSAYHDIVSYECLKRVFYNDPVRLGVYTNNAGCLLASMITRLNGSQDNGSRIITAYTRWK